MCLRLPRLGSIGDVAPRVAPSQSPVLRATLKLPRERAEGHLAEARGDLEKAVAYFLEAVAVAEDFGQTTDATLARIDAARVLSDDRLGPTIAAAREQAERMGVDRLLARLDEIESVSASEAAGA